MATELCIHTGAKMVARQEVYDVPTHGWGPNQCPVPVPHGYLIDKTLEWITSDDLVLLEERHALGHHGANYFGVFTVQRPGVESDHGLAVGIRNSHDRTYSAGLAVGSKVFICDNLAFSAEIVVQRKHTKNVIRDLTRLLAEAFGRFGELFIKQSDRIDTYKALPITNPQAHDLLIRAVDADVIPPSRIPHVLQHWREPQYETFRPRTAWSLFNAFTEDAKTWPPMDVVGRTRRLHALMDHAEYELALASPEREEVHHG